MTSADSALAVMMRAATWVLETATFDMAAGRLTPEQYAELIESLEALTQAVRVRAQQFEVPGGEAPRQQTPDGSRASALDYQQRLGWPVHVQGTIVWMVPGYAAEALNMSKVAGEQVMERLRASGVEAPRINIPGPPDRWAILAQPHDGPVDDIMRLLGDRDVGYAHGGHHEGRSSEWGIDLPPTRHPGHDALTWIRPADTPLPALRLVVDAILATDIGP